MKHSWKRRDVLVTGTGLASAVFAACQAPVPQSPAPQTPVAPPAAANDPEAEALIKKIEDRLLAAKTVRMKLTVQTLGTEEILVTGSFVAAPENTVNMDLTAVLRGEKQQVFLEVKGNQATGGPRGHTFTQGAPLTLRDDLLRMVARTGLSRSVMDLLNGSLPQYATGDQEWIKVARLALGNKRPVQGREVQAINFDILGDDKLMGGGSLFVAEDTGLPTHRTSYTKQPLELVVIERYESLELDATT